MIIKTIVVSVQDNNVKNVCKFLNIIDGVVEYDVAAEESGVAALQTTNNARVERLLCAYTNPCYYQNGDTCTNPYPCDNQRNPSPVA